jgi:acetyl-CoA acetyltransferase
LIFPQGASITGVGSTAITRDSGVPVGDLAAEAVLAALDDSGLGIHDVDAIIDYHVNDSVSSIALARNLGMENLGWMTDYYGGGQHAASILGNAAMLITSGQAEVVVVYRALNGRSGKRMGQSDVGWSEDAEFYRQYGLAGPAQLFAMAAQRYLHDRDMDERDLAAVAMQFRAHAQLNERALMRDPMSFEDYLASPFVATPIRRLDCCQETDAACALVITTAERAAGASRPGVDIRGVVRGGGPGATAQDRATDLSALFSQYLADRLWAASGMTARNVDLAQLYDAYTWVVLRQLEDFGFAARGEAGEFMRSGAGAYTGSLPVNTNGGLLSEGYIHGLNNVVEAVVQLRHEAGERQVADASVALCTGFSGSFGSAALLARQDA